MNNISDMLSMLSKKELGELRNQIVEYLEKKYYITYMDYFKSIAEINREEVGDKFSVKFLNEKDTRMYARNIVSYFRNAVEYSNDLNDLCRNFRLTDYEALFDDSNNMCFKLSWPINPVVEKEGALFFNNKIKNNDKLSEEIENYIHSNLNNDLICANDLVCVDQSWLINADDYVDEIDYQKNNEFTFFNISVFIDELNKLGFDAMLHINDETDENVTYENLLKNNVPFGFGVCISLVDKQLKAENESVLMTLKKKRK